MLTQLKRFRFQLKRNNLNTWLIGIMIGSILPPILLYIFLPPTYPEGARSQILGTISQVLSGIFGITFAGVFLVIQLITGYSSRLVTNSRFLKPTLGYSALFIQAIILPLLVLKNPIEPFVTFCIIECILVLGLLPIYLLYLLRELSPKRLIFSLALEIKHLASKSEDTEVEVQAIGNYLLYSFNAGDYDTLCDGLNSIFDLVSELSTLIAQCEFIVQPYSQKWLGLAGSQDFRECITSMREKTILDSMTRIVQTCTIAGNDPYVPLILLSRFNSWGSKLLTDPRFRTSGIVDYCILSSSVILGLSIERQVLDSTWWLLLLLENSGSLLRDLLQNDEETWQPVCVDYLSTLFFATAAIEQHTKTFYPHAQRITKQACSLFGDPIPCLAERQAHEFLTNVFPDLAYKALSNRRKRESPAKEKE